MTKKYLIRGKEIIVTDNTMIDILFNLLEALNEEKEECFYCDIKLPSKPDKDRQIFNWHLNGHKEESKPECKHENKYTEEEIFLKNWINKPTFIICEKCGYYVEEPKPTLTPREELKHQMARNFFGKTDTNEFLDEILSLFKDTLLKEVRKITNNEGDIEYVDLIEVIKNL